MISVITDIVERRGVGERERERERRERETDGRTDKWSERWRRWNQVSTTLQRQKGGKTKTLSLQLHRMKQSTLGARGVGGGVREQLKLSLTGLCC